MQRSSSRSRSRSFAVVALAATLLTGACTSEPAASADANATFPAEALSTGASDTGALTFEVRTSPQPPAAGTCSVELTVKNASGAPVDGLALSVVPWMPAMGHGTSILAEVTPKGGGVYLVTDVSFFMPGDWELRTSVSGPVSDHVAPVVTVH